jgi:carbamoyl-phosphate synthase large subunit
MTAGNVLVTCGGKWVGMVLQLRRAMAAVGPLAGGKIFIADRAPLTPAGHFADGSFVVPPIDDPGYAGCLADICRRHGVAVVVPLIDLDLLRLAPHREQFTAAGARLVCPEPDLTDLCFDKSRFAGFAAAEGILTPRRVAPEDLATAPMPLFCKPGRGFGSINAGLCSSLERAREILALRPDTIFEEYVRAAEISVDAYIASSGRCTVRVQRIRDKVVGGEAVQSHTVRIPPVRDAAAATIDALARRGLRGPLNVQVFASDPPRVIEVNTRLGSASVLSNVASGGRLFTAVLAEACGLPADGDPDDYREGVSLYRFLGDVFHDGASVLDSVPGRTGR